MGLDAAHCTGMADRDGHCAVPEATPMTDNQRGAHRGRTGMEEQFVGEETYPGHALERRRFGQRCGRTGRAKTLVQRLVPIRMVKRIRVMQESLAVALFVIPWCQGVPCM